MRGAHRIAEGKPTTADSAVLILQAMPWCCVMVGVEAREERLLVVGDDSDGWGSGENRVRFGGSAVAAATW